MMANGLSRNATKNVVVGLYRRLALITTILVLAFSAATLHQSITSTRLLIASDEPDDNGHADSHIGHEPYVNRWQQRFSSKSGHVFFKHIRKAGGTMLRNYLHAVLKHHGHGTFMQFLQNTDQKEVVRHFPFLTTAQEQMAERFFNQTRNLTHHAKRNKVYYIEQEFSTMDWQCRNIDPRWNDSLSVIVLRHPIERHLSEFFYSGPPTVEEFQGKKPSSTFSKFQIDRTKLYTNKTYTHALSMFLQRHLQPWAKERDKFNLFNWYLSPPYVDNFQLRALAGCASGECLDAKNISDKHLDKIAKARPAVNVNATTAPIDSVCTFHPFYQQLDICMKDGRTCPNLCDGPCYYPSAAWGPVGENDLSRAIHSLEGFDIILLTETMDDVDQVALLANVMGVPHNITSISTKERNVNMVKENSREKTHYYRDLMSNLTYPYLVDSFVEENSLEIELYEYAVKLNKLMTERWKREVQWSDDENEGTNNVPPATTTMSNVTKR